MQIFAGIAILGSVLIAAIVGIRLLLLYLKSRELPEFMLGSMLLAGVGIGYGLMIVSGRSGSSVMLTTLSSAASSVGFSMLFLFTWRVFRPDTSWARILALGATAVLVGGAAWRAYTRESSLFTETAVDTSLWEQLQLIGPIATGFGWTAWESLLYYSKMRKRLAIGIGDPVVCNRFLLWGLMGSAQMIGCSFTIAAQTMGVNILQNPTILLASAATTTCANVSLYLAFLTPTFYRNWITARSVEATVEAQA